MTGFWFVIGLFAGALAGGFVVCIFASSRVTQAESEAARWREAAEREYVNGWKTRGSFEVRR